MSIPANFDIATFTGPMLLGHLFNYALLGVVTIQVYIYTLSFPRDSVGIKALVYSIFFLDLLQTGFATHYGWYVLAEGWGNPLVLRFTPWTLATVSPLTALVSFLVQLFYLWRIWVLANGQKKFLPILAIIGITATGSCAAGWYAGVVSGSASMRDISKASELDPEVTAWLAGAMSCDIIITITLVLQLAARRNTGLQSTNRIVHRAMRMAIETGAITSVIVTIELVLFLNSSTTNWYFMFGMLMTKIYSNSLLASLNSRSPTLNGSSQTTLLWQTPGSQGSQGSQGNIAFSSPHPQGTGASDVELGNMKASLNPFGTSLLSSTGTRSEGVFPAVK